MHLYKVFSLWFGVWVFEYCRGCYIFSGGLFGHSATACVMSDQGDCWAVSGCRQSSHVKASLPLVMCSSLNPTTIESQSNCYKTLSQIETSQSLGRESHVLLQGSYDITDDWSYPTLICIPLLYVMWPFAANRHITYVYITYTQLFD